MTAKMEVKGVFKEEGVPAALRLSVVKHHEDRGLVTGLIHVEAVSDLNQHLLGM
jgi:hypothetical protein